MAKEMVDVHGTLVYGEDWTPTCYWKSVYLRFGVGAGCTWYVAHARGWNTLDDMEQIEKLEREWLARTALASAS